MDISIPTKTVTSVAMFIEHIAESYVGQDDVLFRGQRNANWKLVPRLGRVPPRVRFSGPLINLEKKILGDFERLAVPHIGTRAIQNKWDLLALAQHHGLPTRLLDWSSNPLVALWFAVEAPENPNINAVVWAYSSLEKDYVIQEETNPQEIKRTMIFRPRHHDSRIVAQAGWFSVHMLMQGEERFSTFERIESQKLRLRKYVVPPQYFPAIRDDLSRCGISSASLFPDLTGLCGYLNWKYVPLEDEGGYDITTYL